jgi:hypothetical protein
VNKHVPLTLRHVSTSAPLRCAPCVCSLWLVIWAGPAHAQSSATDPARPADRISAHLQLEAPTSCATREALIERVALRSRRLELGTATPGAPEVFISIAPTRRQVSAQLSLLWPDGTSARRTLSAARCEQVVDALALLLVLALDPGAHGAGGAGAPGATPDAASSAQPGVHHPSQPDAAEAAALSSARLASAQLPATPTDDARPAQPPTEQAHELAARHAADAHRARAGLRLERISLGARALLITGVVPGAMPGVGAALQVAWSGTTPWSPALSLGAVHAFRSGVHEPGGVAAFQLNEAVLEVCPLALQRGPFSARSCATGALGSLSASGSHTYSPSSEKNLWASLGGSVLGALDVSELLALELHAGLGAPLSRPRFAFAPQVFSRVAAVTFAVQLAIAAHFW